jgi:hypothetical protein
MFYDIYLLYVIPLYQIEQNNRVLNLEDLSVLGTENHDPRVGKFYERLKKRN